MQTGVWQGYVESLTGPAAPSWVEEEDYLIFPGDPVYEPENWQRILTLRWQAESGALLPQEGRDWAEGSPGECYETALVRLKYAQNAAGAFRGELIRKTIEETGGEPGAMQETGKHGNEAPEVGQALLGQVPGRQSPEEITIFESVGISVEDLSAALLIYRKALEQGVGTDVEI